MRNIKELKILVVDDERELLHMIESILRKDGYSRIYTASNCKEAVQIAKSVKPDAAILDVRLPDGDGFSLLQTMRTFTKIPVLFVSAMGENEDRILGLGLGADDYIVKPFLPKELTLRLGGVLKRVYTPFVLEEERKPVFFLGECRIDLGSGMVQKGDETTALTAKEYILLEKLYQNQGRIVTSDSLCRAAWGDDYFGYENTLMVHIRRIREKIEQNPSEPNYLLTVRGLGYKLVNE